MSEIIWSCDVLRETCVICLSTLQEGSSICDDSNRKSDHYLSTNNVCSHIFHTRCIESWIARYAHSSAKPGCPLCKATLDSLTVLRPDGSKIKTKDVRHICERSRKYIPIPDEVFYVTDDSIGEVIALTPLQWRAWQRETHQAITAARYFIVFFSVLILNSSNLINNVSAFLWIRLLSNMAYFAAFADFIPFSWTSYLINSARTENVNHLVMHSTPILTIVLIFSGVALSLTSAHKHRKLMGSAGDYISLFISAIIVALSESAKFILEMFKNPPRVWVRTIDLLTRSAINEINSTRAADEAFISIQNRITSMRNEGIDEPFGLIASGLIINSAHLLQTDRIHDILPSSSLSGSDLSERSHRQHVLHNCDETISNNTLNHLEDQDNLSTIEMQDISNHEDGCTINDSSLNLQENEKNSVTRNLNNDDTQKLEKSPLFSSIHCPEKQSMASISISRASLAHDNNDFELNDNNNSKTILNNSINKSARNISLNNQLTDYNTLNIFNELVQSDESTSTSNDGIYVTERICDSKRNTLSFEDFENNNIANNNMNVLVDPWRSIDDIASNNCVYLPSLTRRRTLDNDTSINLNSNSMHQVVEVSLSRNRTSTHNTSNVHISPNHDHGSNSPTSNSTSSSLSFLRIHNAPPTGNDTNNRAFSYAASSITDTEEEDLVTWSPQRPSQRPASSSEILERATLYDHPSAAMVQGVAFARILVNFLLGFLLFHTTFEMGKASASMKSSASLRGDARMTNSSMSLAIIEGGIAEIDMEGALQVENTGIKF